MDAKTLHDLKNWVSSLAILPQLIEDDFDFESDRGKRLLSQANEAAIALEKLLPELES